MGASQSVAEPEDCYIAVLDKIDAIVTASDLVPASVSGSTRTRLRRVVRMMLMSGKVTAQLQTAEANLEAELVSQGLAYLDPACRRAICHLLCKFVHGAARICNVGNSADANSVQGCNATAVAMCGSCGPERWACKSHMALLHNCEHFHFLQRLSGPSPPPPATHQVVMDCATLCLLFSRAPHDWPKEGHSLKSGVHALSWQPPNSEGVPAMTVAESADGKATFIAVYSNWREDDFDMATTPLVDTALGSHAATVHTGFLSRVNQLPMQTILQMVRSKVACGSRHDFFITGHSVGGAVAQLLTILLLLQLKACDELSLRIQCISFGAPMIGGADLRELLDSYGLQQNCANFVFGKDIVPGGFHALGQLTASQRQFVHSPSSANAATMKETVLVQRPHVFKPTASQCFFFLSSRSVEPVEWLSHAGDVNANFSSVSRLPLEWTHHSMSNYHQALQRMRRDAAVFLHDGRDVLQCQPLEPIAAGMPRILPEPSEIRTFLRKEGADVTVTVFLRCPDQIQGVIYRGKFVPASRWNLAHDRCEVILCVNQPEDCLPLQLLCVCDVLTISRGHILPEKDTQKATLQNATLERNLFERLLQRAQLAEITQAPNAFSASSPSQDCTDDDLIKELCVLTGTDPALFERPPTASPQEIACVSKKSIDGLLQNLSHVALVVEKGAGYWLQATAVGILLAAAGGGTVIIIGILTAGVGVATIALAGIVSASTFLGNVAIASALPQSPQAIRSGYQQVLRMLLLAIGQRADTSMMDEHALERQIADILARRNLTFSNRHLLTTARVQQLCEERAPHKSPCFSGSAFSELTPASQQAVASRFRAVLIMLELRKRANKHTFISVSGIVNAGKSTLVHKLWGCDTKPGLAKVTATLEQVYRIDESFSVLDFPGGNSAHESHRRYFSTLGASSSAAIVLISLSQYQTQAAVDLVQQATAAVGRGLVVVCLTNAKKDRDLCDSKAAVESCLNTAQELFHVPSSRICVTELCSSVDDLADVGVLDLGALRSWLRLAFESEGHLGLRWSAQESVVHDTPSQLVQQPAHGAAQGAAEMSPEPSAEAAQSIDPAHMVPLPVC